jgi:hypothetical protein
MKLNTYFDKIDTILENKKQDKLTKTEKDLMIGNWKQACLNWQLSPKATEAEYALYKQLEVALCNIIFDVLKHTRKYE